MIMARDIVELFLFAKSLERPNDIKPIKPAECPICPGSE
jgi:hypothetical protein